MYRYNICSVEKILFFLIVVAALFPYSPPILSSSTQPWAPILVVLLVSLKVSPIFLGEKIRIKKISLYMLILLVVFGILQFAKSNDFSIFGVNLLKYCFAFSFMWFGYFWQQKISGYLLSITIFMWVMAGFVQLFNPAIFSFFVSGQEVSVGRGVSSFAPEPSFFSIHFSLIFLIVLRLWLLERVPKTVYLLSAFLILLGLALSASGTSLIAMLFISMFLLLDKKIIKSTLFRKSMIALILLLVLITFSSDFIFTIESRIGTVIKELMDGNIVSDASIMTRIYYILIGFLSITAGRVFGFEFAAFEKSGLSLFNSVPDSIVEASGLIDPNSNGKIHSLFANLALDFGPFVVLIFMFLIYRFFISLGCFDQIVLSGRVLVVLFLLFLMLLPVPIGSPLFFSVIGMSIYKNNFSEKKVRNG